MNEEIEYAEMLEIPVSTVNVIRKNNKKRKVDSDESRGLKEEAISRVNGKITPPYAALSNEYFESLQSEENAPLENENQGGMYENIEEYVPEYPTPMTRKEKAKERLLKAEFGLACALCLGIFLTNVWMPESAINTFFRSLTPDKEIVDERDYTDFTLSSILGVGSEAEMTLSPTGILTFTQEGCVYPTADGTVSAVVQDEDGKYTVTIAHSDSFSGVIDGLDYVYYEIGQTVKHNVPVGYSNGENEVQVAMYSDGNLLNCFSVTEENTLAWVTEAE